MKSAILLFFIIAGIACSKPETSTKPRCMSCDVAALGIHIDTCVASNTIYVYQDKAGHSYLTACTEK